jgi:hypothetical protein
LVFIVAVLLNYLWELAQAPLYVGFESYQGAMLRHCFIASLGDVSWYCWLSRRAALRSIDGIGLNDQGFRALS